MRPDERDDSRFRGGIALGFTPRGASMSKIPPIILLAFATPACLFNSVAKLDAEAKHVQLVSDTDRPSECKFLGKITATSHADDEKLARQGAENELRNRAAELHGNF